MAVGRLVKERMRVKGKPELLAPAGSPEALRAAVGNGADAVYLGGKSFGARAYAVNFNREELQEALRYAHLRGVRVYVTVNTLVDNREFEELVDYLFFLYREGADGILVQDLGVASLIRQVLPDLPLHGSTQMTVHNASGVRFLAELGFQRVVLAREVTLADLRRIRQATTLELEVFVHGALCFCYSGQCLFSSMIGGRSGNRGCCAQPCRLPYQLVDERGKVLSSTCPGEHLLSPKDLMLIKELPALLEAGVTSLKIEGRMKRPEYVATVVRIYRRALDRAWQNPAGFTVTGEELRELAQIFNRGFTTGYLYGNPHRRLMGYTKPNNRGLPLGRVSRVLSAGGVLLRLHLPLSSGDGIEFWTGRGREGMTVHNLRVGGKQVTFAEADTEVELKVPFPVHKGDRVFKTHDRQLVQAARESQESGGRIPLKVRATGRRGEPFCLEGWDPDGHHALVKGSFPGEKALKHPLTPDRVREQVARLGNTPFELVEFGCELDSGVIFPVSEINTLRRSLIARLEALRLEGFGHSLPAAEKGEQVAAFWQQVRAYASREQPRQLPPTLAVAVGDFPALEAALEGGARMLYFGGVSLQGRHPWSRQLLEEGVARCQEQGAASYLIIPRIWQERERPAVQAIISQARELQADGVLVGDLGGLYLARESGLKIATDFSLPAFNDPAILTLLDQGVNRVTISPELNRKQLQRLTLVSTGRLELLVQGTLPLMISEHCVPGAVVSFRRPGGDCGHLCRRTPCFLRDRRGYLFPLVEDESCRMTLYNARELCLIEFLGELLDAGYRQLRLELRYLEAPLVKRVTAIYQHSCRLWSRGSWDQAAAREAWQELASLSPQGLTRGHYLRGVLHEGTAGTRED